MANRVIRGPTVTLDGSVFPCPDLIEEIKDAMMDEPSKSEDIAAQLIEDYFNSTPEERQWMDHTCSLICGYQIKTLLKQAMADEKLLKLLEIQGDEEDLDEEDEG